jgi:hypothetical protein
MRVVPWKGTKPFHPCERSNSDVVGGKAFLYGKSTESKLSDDRNQFLEEEMKK